MPLNAIDLLLLAVVAIGALLGWVRGFLFAALDLVTLALSLGAAFLGYRGVTGWVAQIAPSLGIWIAPLTFVAIFLLVHVILGGAVLRLALRLPERTHRNVGNKLLGILPGAVNGAMHAVVVAVLLLTLPLGPRVGSWAHESSLAARFAAPAEWVEVQLAPVFGPAVERTLQAVTVDPESRENIPLQFRVTQAQPRPDLESEMLEMVNAERRAAGLKPVAPDVQLTELARAHSFDMFARGYFSHVSPDGKDLGHRLQQARVGYLSAGENLAFAPTLYTAHTGLMHSPGHRANILRPQFGRLGIGVLDGGSHGLMVTQDFRN
ncbi:CvpA family protein [Ramlibacter sp.]|uniref:CvpA family protein n=1 Tax=Ramlibacter sp. TaxID=1917967 RepID=UPI002629F47E|nr:CvpA family protein [Ramlibacter sp.]MDB5956103.1 putative rane protein [Ramlibacter sp.]